MSTSPLAEFAQRFGNALALEMKRMAEALGPLLDAVWAAYREAGRPARRPPA